MRTGLAKRCLPAVLVLTLARAFAADTAVLPALPESNAIDPDEVLFASPTGVDRIGRIVVAVTVNGQGPFRFIVDTGANYSTLSPTLAAKLGLQPSLDDPIRVSGITGTAEMPSVPIRELRAGALKIENIRLPVIWAPLMAGAEGILGVAGLTQDSLSVDFQRNRVQIVASTHVAQLKGYSRLGATRVRGGLLSVPALVSGVRVEAIIDTGSERTIANGALRAALVARRPQDRELAKTTNVYGATTDVVTGVLGVSPIIDLGAVRVARATLVFGDFHIFDVWGLTERPAIIVGMDILGTVSAFDVDFRQGQIYIDSRPPPGSGIGTRLVAR